MNAIESQRFSCSILIMVVAGLVVSACRVQTPSSLLAGDQSIQLRVIHVDPAPYWQITASPFAQTVVLDVVHDPAGLLPTGPIKLRIIYHPSDDTPMLTRTEGGAVLDQNVLHTGALIRLRTLDTDRSTCPAPRVKDGNEYRYLDPMTGARFDGLPCYDVGIVELELDSSEGAR